MLVKQELISKVKDLFGLNIYETKVWLALLRKGIASAGEVASISGVPRSRTYDVLENLEKKGFAIIKLEKPVKYIGVKPQIILEKIKNNVRKDAEERVTELAKIKDSDEFAKLELLYSTTSNTLTKEDFSIALKGKSNISNHLREILKNTKKEVLICTETDDIVPKLKLFQKTFEIMKKDNVNITMALSGDEKTIKKISEDLGIKIKKVDITAKFFIIDRKEIIFYLSKKTDENDLAIWLNSEFFAQAFAGLFEQALKFS
jgi:sugar-specific transcriptional regulator TrmB